MIDFKELTLADQATINTYFQQGQYNNSECTFTNLYIWRNCYQVQWAIVEGFLIIKPQSGDDSWILPPYGDYKKHDLPKALSLVQNYFTQMGKPLIIRAITEPIANVLNQQCPDLLKLEEERDLDDYLYSGEDLRLLKGRKYHSKRNHLTNFRKNHSDYQYERLTKAMIPEVEEFLERWCAQKECKGAFDEGLICERQAIKEALREFDTLPYIGAVIRLNGQIEAFTMGEMLNEQTLVIHVEKANSDINGLYGAIHQDYLLHEWPEVPFVNREEDTGDEGLRTAKLSYHPLELVVKYKGVLQHE